MISKLVEEHVLKSYQCDRYGFMRPISLMNELQGLAGKHADKLGFGRDVCLSRGIAWVVTHMFVDIFNLPVSSLTSKSRSERTAPETDGQVV